MNLERNPEARGVAAGAILVVVGLLLMTVPGLAGMDGMSGGYALGLVGVMAIVTGIVTAAMFAARAVRLNAILSGRNLLAHWVYDGVQVDQQARRDRQETSRRNRGLFLLVAVLMIGCTGLFAVIGLLGGQGDDVPLFLALMAGVLAVVAAAAFGIPYLQQRQAIRSSREAYIATDGLYINGALHTWDPPLAAKEAVALVDDKDGRRLVFDLQARTGPLFSQQAYRVEVPVPEGETATAQRVVQRLQN